MRINKILRDSGYTTNQADDNNYSTMGKLVNIWDKKGYKQVVVGLHCVGYAPTLVSPIPFDAFKNWSRQDCDEKDRLPETPFINKWLESKTDEEVKSWLNSLKV